MVERPTAWTMAVLGWIAGAVDAVGYQTLGHVFISNMTGNADGFSIAISRGHLQRAVERGYALLAFASGVFLATALAADTRDAGSRERAPSARLLGVELALVVGTSAAIFWFARRGGPLDGAHAPFYVVATLAAMSMGIQNIACIATPTDDGPFTTHITGALTSFVHGVARRVLGLGPARARRHASLLAGFLAGGFSAMLAFDTSPFAASLLPIPVLAILFARRIHAERRGRSDS